MFIAALLVISRPWKKFNCPLINEWIKKIWYVSTMEYYTTGKNNDIFKLTGKWIDLENIIVHEITQTLKNKYVLIHKWLIDRR